MASKAKQQKILESTPTDADAHCKKGQQTMFPPTDVILKVEGESFHLNRKWLAENSPVFKTMFESEFKEKHNRVIFLPGKKFKDFEMFLFSFYFPANIRPIQEDTVLVILPLADEYQVLPVINKCGAFLVELFQGSQSYWQQSMDVNAFVRYVNYAELYNLTEVLSITPKRSIEYSIQSLEGADIDKKISVKMRMEIYKEKCKRYEPYH